MSHATHYPPFCREQSNSLLSDGQLCLEGSLLVTNDFAILVQLDDASGALKLSCTVSYGDDGCRSAVLPHKRVITNRVSRDKVPPSFISAAGTDLDQLLQNLRLVLGVKRGRGLVQDQDAVLQHRARAAAGRASVVPAVEAP